jgi:2-polyprenyl-3-methyl-5-hydroxy-6-metoxy-1,4-benzoquinol methylase
VRRRGFSMSRWLRARDVRPEIMDQSGLPESDHFEALQGLERINWWSGSARTLWRRIGPLLDALGPAQTLLDIATGAGDVPISIWQKARRAGLFLEMAACDRSSTALAFARQRAATLGAPVTFFSWDAVDELPGRYDFVTCSLFLHHLSGELAIRFLRCAAKATKRLLLIQDLRRCLPGLLLANVGTRWLSASPIVRNDGPQSVRAAFTMREALCLAKEAGLDTATVAPCWPFRFLLTWKRN